MIGQSMKPDHKAYIDRVIYYLNDSTGCLKTAQDIAYRYYKSIHLMRERDVPASEAADALYLHETSTVQEGITYVSCSP